MLLSRVSECLAPQPATSHLSDSPPSHSYLAAPEVVPPAALPWPSTPRNGLLSPHCAHLLTVKVGVRVGVRVRVRVGFRVRVRVRVRVSPKRVGARDGERLGAGEAREVARARGAVLVGAGALGGGARHLGAVELGGVEAEALGDLRRLDALDGLAQPPDGRVQLLRHVPRRVHLGRGVGFRGEGCGLG